VSENHFFQIGVDTYPSAGAHLLDQFSGNRHIVSFPGILPVAAVWRISAWVICSEPKFQDRIYNEFKNHLRVESQSQIEQAGVGVGIGLIFVVL
jgi:hypothetical protein